MKLIVALGNPGLKYEKTKHNTGFMALDHYLDEKGLRLDRDKFTALYAKEKVAGALATIQTGELDQMIQDGEDIEVKCHFCNSTYKFSVEELKEILAKRNEEK